MPGHKNGTTCFTNRGRGVVQRLAGSTYWLRDKGYWGKRNEAREGDVEGGWKRGSGRDGTWGTRGNP